MYKIFSVFTIFALSLILISCDKDNSPKQISDSQKDQQQENTEENSVTDTDSVLTAEESFSSAIVQDIIGETDDIDLQVYLEEQIYPIVSGSDKVTIDRISSSLYLLSYNDKGAMKNFLIQKFYNPSKDEFIFEKKETELNSTKQYVK